MTRLVKTLMTNINVVCTLDVSRENETYNLSEISQMVNLKVAAVRWQIPSRNRLEARIIVLRFIFSLIVKNNGLVHKMAGAFDDPESGFVGIGTPEMVKVLFA